MCNTPSRIYFWFLDQRSAQLHKMCSLFLICLVAAGSVHEHCVQAFKAGWIRLFIRV